MFCYRVENSLGQMRWCGPWTVGLSRTFSPTISLSSEILMLLQQQNNVAESSQGLSEHVGSRLLFVKPHKSLLTWTCPPQCYTMAALTHPHVSQAIFYVALQQQQGWK